MNFARSGGSTRTFDFEIELKSGTVHTFSSIVKEEYSKLFDFITAKKLHVKNRGKNVIFVFLFDFFGCNRFNFRIKPHTRTTLVILTMKPNQTLILNVSKPRVKNATKTTIIHQMKAAQMKISILINKKATLLKNTTAIRMIQAPKMNQALVAIQRKRRKRKKRKKTNQNRRKQSPRNRVNVATRKTRTKTNRNVQQLLSCCG